MFKVPNITRTPFLSTSDRCTKLHLYYNGNLFEIVFEHNVPKK